MVCTECVGIEKKRSLLQEVSRLKPKNWVGQAEELGERCFQTEIMKSFAPKGKEGALKFF